jgi:pimeloyl-ACP methyl ester carboxylesterase
VLTQGNEKPGFMKKSVHYRNENVISYAEYGNENGFPLFVNHGLIASIDDYQLFERLIQFGARLVCVARPGYGESSPYIMQNMAEWAELVSVIINELGISQFDILGMSSGAPYSYAIGYKFPDKVRNIYIFSGIPALYDEQVLSYWPYPVNRNATISELETLAYELFFSNLAKEDLDKNDIKDSMMHNCFGIAQDLKLRCVDWGFPLSDVKTSVTMRHSKFDNAVPFITALLTSKLLPNCELEIKESDEHFSKDALDDFIKTVIAGNHEREKKFSENGQSAR